MGLRFRGQAEESLRQACFCILTKKARVAHDYLPHPEKAGREEDSRTGPTHTQELLPSLPSHLRFSSEFRLTVSSPTWKWKNHGKYGGGALAIRHCFDAGFHVYWDSYGIFSCDPSTPFKSSVQGFPGCKEVPASPSHLILSLWPVGGWQKQVPSSAPHLPYLKQGPTLEYVP